MVMNLFIRLVLRFFLALALVPISRDTCVRRDGSEREETEKKDSARTSAPLLFLLQSHFCQ